MDKFEIYCPVCGRWLTPDNPLDVLVGIADSYVYVHDEIPHSDDDLEALERGVQ